MITHDQGFPCVLYLKKKYNSLVVYQCSTEGPPASRKTAPRPLSPLGDPSLVISGLQEGSHTSATPGLTLGVPITWPSHL